MSIDTPPLPPSLALPDGEEPVSESALTWLADLLAADPTVTLEEVLAEAEQVASNPALPPSRGAYPEASRELLEAQNAAEVARWEIDGTGSAEWALRKLAATKAELDEVEERATAWIEQIHAWREARLRPLEARSSFFTAKLCGWLRRLREADPKVKSRSLPSGTVSSRTVRPRIDIVDVDAVEAWANAAGVYDEVVKVATTVRLDEFKKVVTIDAEAGVVRDKDSGQPVPGVAVHAGGVSFSVKVNGD